MSNDMNTLVDELELQVIEDGESVVDPQATPDGEGEVTTVLDLEVSEPKADKLTPAQEQAERQVEAWLQKVTSGAAKIEDAPGWVQKRLNTALELEAKQPEIEEVVRKTLERERANAEFKELQAQIPPLTPAQASELKERFNALKSPGKEALVLRTLLDAMGLSQKVKEAEQRGIAKGRLSLPPSGQPAGRKAEQRIIGGVPEDVINDDKKWNEAVRAGSR